MNETEYSPNPGGNVPPAEHTPGGSGGSGTQEVFYVTGSGSPSDTPEGDDAIAYNDAGNFWVWNGVWNQIS